MLETVVMCVRSNGRAWPVARRGFWPAAGSIDERGNRWNVEGMSFRRSLTFGLNHWTWKMGAEVGVCLPTDLEPAGASGGLRASIPGREWVGAHREQVGEVARRVEEGRERRI